MTGVGSCVLFGGAGSVGTHVAQFLLREGLTETLTVVDVRAPSTQAHAARLQEGLRSGEALFRTWDVRQPLPPALIPKAPDLILNMVGAEGRHDPAPIHDFVTHIRAAQNVCQFASDCGAKQIAFLSSASVYGPAMATGDESARCAPQGSDGCARLAAERIYRTWQGQAPGRTLLVLRPGLIFGPGRDSCVRQLVRNVVRGKLASVGNASIRKAGVYVKELGPMLQCALEHQDRNDARVLTINVSFDPVPALHDYVDAIRRAADLRSRSWNVPSSLASGIRMLARACGPAFSFASTMNPAWSQATPAEPMQLRRLHYTWKYSLEQAMRDWQCDEPDLFVSRNVMRKAVPMRIVQETSPSEQSLI